jgi:hypothetical protein
MHQSGPSKENGEKSKGFVEWAEKLFYDLKITDIVIALASVALAVYTLQLRRSTDQLAKEGTLQRRDARRNSARQAWQTRKSLAIAKESADAANNSVILAERTAKRQLRAYLAIVKASLSDDRSHITLDVRNGGQTPAHNVNAHLNWHWRPFGERLPDDFTFPDFNTNDDGSKNAFFGVNSEFPWTFPIDAGKLAEAKAGVTTLYCYGWIAYFDVFSERQTTTFCYETMPRPDGKCAFRLSDRHNEST